ncbi:MAG: hypothetical protein J6S13_05070 [Clostridia bacterium]|nr:hypothetical protein [Clostridia bacterium]
MAQCRNCKKEVAKDANICPYCGTSFPSNDFISKAKSILLAVAFVAIFIFVIVLFVKSVGGMGVVLSALLLGVGAGVACYGVIFFTKSEEIAQREKGDKEFINKFYKILGATMTIGGIVLCIVCFTQMIK